MVLLLVAHAIPAHQLEEREWKKLVSAFFTGAILSDSNGQLLIQGEILEILSNHSSDWLMEEHIQQDPTYRYFPSLTASYAESSHDHSIKHVSFSGSDSNAEEKIIRNILLMDHRDVHNIVTSFSPCYDCAVRIINFCSYSTSPIIYICWVHEYPRSNISLHYIKHLIRQGFTVKVWETEQLLLYLFQHYPSSELKEELLEAYYNTSDALSECDNKTQELIDSVSEPNHKNQTDEDEQEDAYWYGRGNHSRHHDEDDDDGPGTGGTTGGTGGGGTCYSCYSISSDKKTFSSASSFKGSSRASMCCSLPFNHILAVVVLFGILLHVFDQWESSYKYFEVSTNCRHQRTKMLYSVIHIIIHIRERVFKSLK